MFGSSSRKKLTDGENCSPGMQTYKLPSKAIEGSKWVMGAKLGSSFVNGGVKNSPGPGGYDPDYKTTV